MQVLLMLPDDHDKSDADAAARHAAASQDARRLQGLRVLIVEDEFLVGMLLEEDLRAAGCSLFGPIPDLAKAVEISRGQALDLAILDINLRGEMVYPLADELLARGVPVLFLSGYGSADLPERMRAVPRVAKPYEPGALLREIERAIS